MTFLLAYLLLKNDFIVNIRFYNSSINPNYDQSGDRNYAEGVGTDGFGKSLILLFPSPASILNWRRDMGDNFVKKFFLKSINNITEDKWLDNIKSLVNIIVRIYKNESINRRLINLKEATEKELGKLILIAGEKSDEKLNFIIRSLSLKEEVKKELGNVILPRIKDDKEKLDLTI